ncbi:NADP-dependent oxidoreductase domain-containing protein [Lipomyces oligophaga]|uniref:NADP-dependent oxidoreductase domain-containing protein n=1 Tax=Lipomyces oligophaga TaxID=45792 RepID=UPI0034D01F01
MAIKIAGIPVGPLGFGLMGLTWRPKITSDEQAFPVMKKAIELGATFFNSGEFYGTPEPTLNLQLVNRFFTKYPEYKDKVCLSVKGGVHLKTLAPDGSPEGVRTSVMNTLKYLGDAKKLDIFECGRVDPKVPIETTMGELKKIMEEGLIGGISLSEVGEESIRRAAKVAPISAVEIEYSMWCVDAAENGVLQTCAELKIPVIAYSPLGRGFLTGQIRSRADIPAGDMRLFFERFSEENLPINLKLADEVVELAKAKGVTPAQLALSWIKKHEEKLPGLTIIPIPGATTLERVEENLTSIVPMSDDEFAKIGEIIKSIEIKGGRYNTHAEALLWY